MMGRQTNVEEVAGWLTAAGHDLERALAAAKKISEQDGHDVGQLDCGVRLAAAGWVARSKRLDARTKEDSKSRIENSEESEAATLRRLARKELPAGGDAAVA